MVCHVPRPAFIFLLPLLLALFLAACDEEGEDIPDESEEPKASESMAHSDETVTPTSANWITYQNPFGLFSIQYPPGWVNVDDSLYSRDIREDLLHDPSYRAKDVTEIELGYYEAKGSSGCGAVELDPDTGQPTTPKEDATETTLADRRAWEVIREDGNAIQGELTRIHAISLVHDGYCINIAAYFYTPEPDSSTYSNILGTLVLHSGQ